MVEVRNKKLRLLRFCICRKKEIVILGLGVVYEKMNGRKCQIRKRRGRASIPEKMNKNGPVVAEILQFQVLPSLL
jgi:hypothetical protein